jgi:hypothetical protein
MSTGALIFAHNNAGIDYTKLAVFSAARVKEYLDIPVSIVTDNVKWLEKTYPDHNFDKVIEISTEPSTQKLFYDGSISSKKLDWHNVTRSRCYELSPYDTTLVLDSDYILNSDTLKLALNRDESFQIYRNSFDLSGWRESPFYKRINQYSIPFYWATVFIFKKNQLTQAFFDLVSYIKSNWLYFKVLYSIDSNVYRNDFAFSIAIHIMNGKMEGDFAIELPGKMTYLEDRDILVTITDDKVKFITQKKDHLGEYIAGKVQGIDVHIMNKYSLSRVIDGDNGV